MTEPLSTRQATDDETSATWNRILRKAGLVYLFSRVCVLAGAAIVAAELRADINQVKGLDVPFADPHLVSQVAPKSAVSPMLDVLSSWDGNWYLRIVRDGYPRHVQPHVTYEVADARAAFFPTYPMLVRAVDKVLPGGDTTAALFTNFVLGAVAILLLGVLAKRLYGQQVAAKAMVLAAMFPGSFVLSFAYSEALLLVFAMACLWCLMSQRWVAAGLLAALATATRPNGLALVLACAVASWLAIRRERAWRSVAAPILAPVGFIAFQLWLGNHAGEARVWFRVQRQAWNEGASFGVTAVRQTFDALSQPLTSPTNTITAASVATTALLIYFTYRKRVPWPMMAYSAGILALMLLPNTVTARPRFVYTAFPLFISAAAYLHTVRRDLWPYVIGACSAGLVALTALYGVFGAIP
ncbi:MAG TPA: mannosyltransferase family protein [Ilumatobacteraceae bacterium]|nr:mannosyltransferase family protein [Ilumatobacteraceae bacterium]